MYVHCKWLNSKYLSCLQVFRTKRSQQLPNQEDLIKKTKIKNSKIKCWRMELAEFSYTILYRPGSDNVVPGALTSAFCATTQPLTNLRDVYN